MVYAAVLAQYNPVHVDAVLNRLCRTPREEFEKAIPELGDLEAMVKTEEKKDNAARRGQFIPCGKCINGKVFKNDKGNIWSDAIDYKKSEMFVGDCDCRKAWLAK